MTTLTITMEVTDEMAERIRALPQAELDGYALEGIAYGLQDAEPRDSEHSDDILEPLSAADLAGIGEGIAAAQRGEGVPLEELEATLPQRQAARRSLAGMMKV